MHRRDQGGHRTAETGGNVRSQSGEGGVCTNTGTRQERDQTNDTGQDDRHEVHAGTNVLCGVDEDRDEAGELQSGSEELSTDDQANDTGKHLTHGLEEGDSVLQHALRVAQADQFNQHDEDPHEPQSGDRVDLDARDDELGERNHQEDREPREDGVPDRSVRSINLLGISGIGVNVIALVVIVALNEVVADGHGDQRRDGNRQLALHEVDDRVETSGLSSQVGRTGGWA